MDDRPVSVSWGQWLTNQVGGIVTGLIGAFIVAYVVSAIQVHDDEPLPPLSGSRIAIVLIVAGVALLSGAGQGKSAEPVPVWVQGVAVAGVLTVFGIVGIADGYRQQGELGLLGSLLAFVAGPSYLLGVVWWEKRRRRRHGRVVVGRGGSR